MFLTNYLYDLVLLSAAFFGINEKIMKMLRDSCVYLFDIIWHLPTWHLMDISRYFWAFIWHLKDIFLEIWFENLSQIYLRTNSFSSKWIFLLFCVWYSSKWCIIKGCVIFRKKSERLRAFLYLLVYLRVDVHSCHIKLPR